MPAPSDVRIYAQTPVVPLRAAVRQFLVVEFPDGRDDAHLPETGLIAALRFRGDCHVNGRPLSSSAILSGLTDCTRAHQHSRNNAILIVHFTPLGAASVTRESLDQLWNRSEDLGEALGRAADVAELVDRVADATTHPQRVQLVERFLLDCLRSNEPDALSRAAIAWIQQAQPSARMTQLVRHIGLSQSALERRFRRHVGATPKQFASLHRLAQAARLRRAGASFTDTAHFAGYYDQAHFNRAFKQVTGLAPGDYFAQEDGRD